MPEGPEVAVITKGLSDLLVGKAVNQICFHSKGRYGKKVPDGFTDFEKLLPVTIKSIECKGKFIYWEFSNGTYMFNTLGMSGVWIKSVDGNTAMIINYSNDMIKNITKSSMEDGKCKQGKMVYFDDVRHFGTIKFVNSKSYLDAKLKTIGPDMLHDKSMSYNKFNTIIKKQKDKNITVVLMNQKVISGVGNYLKSEILYASRISPYRTCDTLKDVEIRRIYKVIRSKIKESFDLGGMSRRDYRDVNGNVGTFANKLEIYGKEKDKKGNKIINFTSKDNRTTYWVKEIQK
jgi:DNA-formamidopyrimidine glycosylase